MSFGTLAMASREVCLTPLLLLSLLPPLPLLLLLLLRAESFNPEALEDLRSWCARTLGAKRRAAAGEVCRADFWRSLVAAVRNDEGGRHQWAETKAAGRGGSRPRRRHPWGSLCVRSFYWDQADKYTS